MENFWNPVYEKPFGGFARVRDNEGFLTLKLFKMGNTPETTPFTSIRDDYSDIVHGIFLENEKWDQQTIWAVSHPVSFQEVVDAYNRIAGKELARYVVPSAQVKADTPEKVKEVTGISQYVEFVKGN